MIWVMLGLLLATMLIGIPILLCIALIGFIGIAAEPGVVMPTLGLNEYDPVTKMQVKQGGLTDQQIADIVAYLLALK